MTTVRYIQHVGTDLSAPGEGAAQARERLGAKFPRNALRRMTHLGMLLGSAMDGIALTPEDAVVYASTYAETRALEDYLTSFPTPSPALFQTSIHPAAVQQVLISRQQPVARLWPLAGPCRPVEQALLTALLESAPRVVVLGGEERGTWMLDHGAASDRAFGFALVLGTEAAGAVGTVSLGQDASETGDESCPALVDFADALAARRAIAWRGLHGSCSVSFSPGASA